MSFDNLMHCALNVSIYILKIIIGNLLSKYQNNFCSFYNVNSSGHKVVNILWNVNFFKINIVKGKQVCMVLKYERLQENFLFISKGLFQAIHGHIILDKNGSF